MSDEVDIIYYLDQFQITVFMGSSMEEITSEVWSVGVVPKDTMIIP